MTREDEAREPLERLLELEAWREHERVVQAQAPMRPEPLPGDYATGDDYWRDVTAWRSEKAARLESYPSPLGYRKVVLVEVAKGADGSITYAPNFDSSNDAEGRAP
jgi:hypothetical protein